MSFLFQCFVTAFVILSFIMIVAVPVAYASPQNWEGAKPIIWVGSIAWFALVFLVGGFNYLVV